MPPHLIVAALLSACLYLGLIWFPALNGGWVLLFLAIFAALFGLYALAYQSAKTLPDSKRLCWGIAAAALLFRLCLLPVGIRTDLPLTQALAEDLRGEAVTFQTFLLYDLDVWRYLWEGRVWASGFNPYRHAPQDAALDAAVPSSGPQAEVWEEIRQRVTYPELPAIYPPAAQMVFRLSHATFPASVVGWKFWTILFEALGVCFVALALRRLGRAVAPGLLLMAWNPLMVKSFAGSAHFESVLVAALALFAYLLVCGRNLTAYAALGVATLSKLVPGLIVVALPPLLSVGLLAFIGVLLLGCLPFLDAGLIQAWGTVSVFLRDWSFNAGPHRLLESLLGVQGAFVGYLTLLTGAIWYFRTGLQRQALEQAAADRADPSRLAKSRLEAALWILGLAIVLGPVVNPWYVTWLIPLASILRSRAWLAFSWIVFLAFLVLLDGEERIGVLAWEYAMLAWMMISAPPEVLHERKK